ncbi:MAG TPA: DUF5320 domain-containing protein [Candidatus Omnitrophota bacterium]|nr:DUF5320 domain-containing protein [Candidatus Omnitrophota bacterium]
MPGFDGTGPAGMGPMTGGGRGFCALPAGGRAAGFWGRRPLAGRGGRGRRNMYFATGLTGYQRAGYGLPAGITAEEEKNILKGEEEFLKRELENIQKRMAEL